MELLQTDRDSLLARTHRPAHSYHPVQTYITDTRKGGGREECGPTLPLKNTNRVSGSKYGTSVAGEMLAVTSDLMVMVVLSTE